MSLTPTKFSRRFAVTGSGGYLGSRLCQSLARDGWDVFRLTSRASSDAKNVVPFSLKSGPPPDVFARSAIDSLVHCAYNFRPRSWSDIFEMNVRGSIALLQAAAEQGVRHLLFVSTMSAFAGCKSMYGRAKLEIEKETLRLGGTVIRPGLIYGPQSGSLMGALDRMVAASPVVPTIIGGSQGLYAAHEEDLAYLVGRLLVAQETPREPIIAASEEKLLLSNILRTIAARRNKRIRLVPVPWRLVWGSLRAVELLGIPVTFRSDSVVSLVNQDPAPDFSWLRRAGIRFRAFT